MFYRFVSFLCLMFFCFLASATAFASEVTSSQVIEDPKLIGIAAAYTLLEFVLGKTNLIKSNSILELALRSVGKIVLATFQLEKYGYKMKE